QHSAVVPAEMAIGTRLIFPSIAPIDAGAGDNNRRVSDGGLSRGRFNQHSAIISDAQPAQAELRRSKVIETGLEIRQVTANQIQLDFVKRSGAGRGAKVNLAARILSLPSDAGGEIEKLSHDPVRGSALKGDDSRAVASKWQRQCRLRGICGQWTYAISNFVFTSDSVSGPTITFQCG